VIGNHDQLVLKCAVHAGLMNFAEDTYPTPFKIQESVCHIPLSYYGSLECGPTIDEQMPHYQIARSLTKQHLAYLSRLPLTISIPLYNSIVVHAGLVPGVPLVHQLPFNCMYMRNLDRTTNTAYDKPIHGSAWAKSWNGPETVIFGHDAQRGYQHETYCIGLDTGCCYGRSLTGYLLPDKKYVCIEAAQQYSMPTGDMMTVATPSAADILTTTYASNPLKRTHEEDKPDQQTIIDTTTETESTHKRQKTDESIVAMSDIPSAPSDFISVVPCAVEPCAVEPCAVRLVPPHPINPLGVIVDSNVGQFSFTSISAEIQYAALHRLISQYYKPSNHVGYIQIMQIIEHFRDITQYSIPVHESEYYQFSQIVNSIVRQLFGVSYAPANFQWCFIIPQYYDDQFSKSTLAPISKYRKQPSLIVPTNENVLGLPSLFQAYDTELYLRPQILSHTIYRFIEIFYRPCDSNEPAITFEQLLDHFYSMSFNRIRGNKQHLFRFFSHAARDRFGNKTKWIEKLSDIQIHVRLIRKMNFDPHAYERADAIANIHEYLLKHRGDKQPNEPATEMRDPSPLKHDLCQPINDLSSSFDAVPINPIGVPCSDSKHHQVKSAIQLFLRRFLCAYYIPSKSADDLIRTSDLRKHFLNVVQLEHLNTQKLKLDSPVEWTKFVNEQCKYVFGQRNYICDELFLYLVPLAFDTEYTQYQIQLFDKIKAHEINKVEQTRKKKKKSNKRPRDPPNLPSSVPHDAIEPIEHVQNKPLPNVHTNVESDVEVTKFKIFIPVFHSINLSNYIQITYETIVSIAHIVFVFVLFFFFIRNSMKK
jgi:hypothetical protein